MKFALVLALSLILSGCLSIDAPKGVFSAYINRDRVPDSGFIPNIVHVTQDGEEGFYLRHQAEYSWTISQVDGPLPSKDVVLTIFDQEQKLDIFISGKTAYRYLLPNPERWPQKTILMPEDTGLNYELRISVIAIEKERTVPPYTQCIGGEESCTEQPGGTYGTGEYEYSLTIQFWNERGEVVVTLI